jgi:hypothetical protein
MNIWYASGGGVTLHNKRGTPNYVEGEPPKYPVVELEYIRWKSLVEGFARCGYPNTGSLDSEEIGSGRLALNGYTLDTVATVSRESRLAKSQLLGFASIKAGDFILMVAPGDAYNFHFGMILTKEKTRVNPHISPRPNAYYFYHEIKSGDYYECAHRVNVEWAKEQSGDYAEVYAPKIHYRLAFSQVHEDMERLQSYIKKYGFWN